MKMVMTFIATAFILSISAYCQNIGIGTITPLAKLHIAGDVKIDASNSIEFGAGVVGKEFNSGKIGYETFTPGTLDIVGAGTTGTNRKIKFWSEAGAYFNGSVGIGIATPSANLHIAGNVKIDANNTIEFGAGVGGKEVSAGKIGYQSFGIFNALDIVGAGTTGGNRKIKFWNEGGASFTGNVGIGTDNPTYKLSVLGNIRSTEVVVETGWADYVFDEKYVLPLLSDIEKFIKQNKHLPNIPSAAEIEKNGLFLGDTQKKMMEKIEELTLYMIEVNKKIEKLEKMMMEKK